MSYNYNTDFTYDDYTSESGRSIIGTMADINLAYYTATLPFAASRIVPGPFTHIMDNQRIGSVPLGLRNFVVNKDVINPNADDLAFARSRYISRNELTAAGGLHNAMKARRAGRLDSSISPARSITDLQPSSQSRMQNAFFHDRYTDRVTRASRVFSGGVVGTIVGGVAGGAFGAMGIGAAIGGVIGGFSGLGGRALAGGVVGFALAKEAGLGNLGATAVGAGVSWVMYHHGGFGPMLQGYNATKGFGQKLTQTRFGTKFGYGGWLNQKVTNVEKIMQNYYGRFANKELSVRSYSYTVQEGTAPIRRGVNQALGKVSHVAEFATVFTAKELAAFSGNVQTYFQESLRKTERVRLPGTNYNLPLLRRRMTKREFITNISDFIDDNINGIIKGDKQKIASDIRQQFALDNRDRSIKAGHSINIDDIDIDKARPTADGRALAGIQSTQVAKDLARKRTKVIFGANTAKVFGTLFIGSLAAQLGMALISEDTHSSIIRSVRSVSSLAQRFVGQEFGHQMPITNMVPTTDRQRQLAAMQRTASAASLMNQEARFAHAM